MRTRLAPAAVLAGLLAAAGCGGSGPAGQVAGTVTFNGKPVANGSIQFTPADGKGEVVGCKLSPAGGYLLDVPPGKMVVAVAGGTDAASGPMSTADLAAKAGKKTGSDPTVIPANAPGNNVTVDVVPGPNVVNVDVTGPKK